MERSNFFLRTKLLPPRALSDVLDRPRLIEKLQSNVNAPLTMVAADAGCGKTTLIADFIRQQSRPVVWYQLDSTDADPIVFLGYVAQGIRAIFDDFGEAFFPYLYDTSEEFLQKPERAVDLLINEILQNISQPFILVLDDYHHIGRNTEVHKLVDRLLQYSSDLIHIIITTRDVPPLAITKRRSQSSALMLTRDDLLFNDDEVKDLFRGTINVELRESEIAEYRSRTHGWITALQLVRQVAEQEQHLHGDARPVDLSAILQQSERDIFDYFAEEVFLQETSETKNLLLQLSLLDTLPLELCSRLFPEARCAATLPELAQKNVFLTVASDGGTSEEYRFHPLFREFLRRRFRSESGFAALQAERNRIADYFLGQKQWELAVPQLLYAENFDLAARVIAEHGREWLATGAFTSLGYFARKIPQEFLESHPRSLLHQAEVARLQGETETSSTVLNVAVKLLHQQCDSEGEAAALHSLASLARRKGRIKEALELIEAAEVLITETSETYLKCSNTRGLCLITERKWPEAEQQFRFALELAEKLGSDQYIRLVTHNLALAPGFRGDFGEALRWFKRIFRTDQPDKQLPQEAIGHLNVARLHLYRGEFDDSEKHLERSLELCQLYNLRFLRGEIFEAYGNFYRDRGDFPHAEEYYERALKAYDDAEINVAAKEYNEEIAKFYRLRGDLTKARITLERVIEFRHEQEDTAGVQTARLSLCQVQLAAGKTEGLIETIKELQEFFHTRSHFYDEAVAAMLLAEANFSMGRHGELVEPIMRVLDLAARFDYEFWLKSEIRRNALLFSTDDVAERLPPDLRVDTVVEESPSAVEPAVVEASPVPLTDLTIKVLGYVEIYRDKNKPLAGDAWTTRRSRDIFCYIATCPHRRVAKDVLVETFWPNEDPATVEKNFHPTISHIRKALNSRQAYKQNFLVFRDGAYQLNADLEYFIDAEGFEREIAAAEAAKRAKDPGAMRLALEAAYELYRGEFMSGIYEDWAVERRSFYTDQFLRIVSGLAKLSFSEKRWSSALKFAGEILKDDPFREDMHRLTMKIHHSQAKPASVKKHFDGLKSVLASELGIEPSPETRRLYEELMK